MPWELGADAIAAGRFQKAAEVAAIARAVRYAGLDGAEAARRWSELEVAMEKRWPEFVKTTAPPESGPT